MNFKANVEFRDPKSLTPYLNNAKKHPPQQLAKLAAQIEKVGFLQPILVDTAGVIIAGHGRREAAIKLKLDKVPVIVASHLDEYQVKAFRIADNKVAESDWDEDILKFELEALAAVGLGELTAFDPKELAGLLDDEEVAVDDDEDGEEEQEIPDEEDEESAGDGQFEQEFICAIHCKSEQEMKALYEEISAKGHEVKLLT